MAVRTRVCPTPTSPQRDNRPAFTSSSKRKCGANCVGWEGRTAQQVSSLPAAVAASPVDAVQAGGGIEGVAVRALDTSRAEGTTGGIALRTPGPLPPRPVPRTAKTAVASVANLGTVCRRYLHRWTCLDIRPGRHSRGDGPSRRQPLHEYRAWYRG